ncbi:uncharacterized protein TM35_000072140 [Trypanosoma theileri]|uniref:Transmembrane protein n=1 Tax=Trypanosoma theileri TaxID=67003 RepID=A0A1X0P312_9TRYP|nr:uncharacterized protein TM35_000072140 [Trypanosoma theileri]ORC90790.1 hypothetical protein TM35_000072140 [Trypanosoma theileri]
MRYRNNIPLEETCNKENDEKKKDQCTHELPLFRWLDPHNPARARRRIGDIYWSGWRTFVLGFFLSGVGLTLILLGAALWLFVVDTSRGIALFTVGCILSIPGIYSLVVLWCYVCGVEGYSYSQLLDG